MLLPPPPPEVRAGDRIPAGLGFSTVLPDFDFETYSEAGFVWDEAGNKWTSLPNAAKKGLPVVGAANYAKHSTAEVLCMAYNLKQGEGRKLWRPGLPAPKDLFAHLTSGGLIEAHNVGFERWIWEEVCVKKMGWPAIHPSQYRCSAAKARASALPGALGELAKVLGTAQQKDGDGKRLIDKFTMPRTPTVADPRRRIPTLWTPADAEREFRSLESTAKTPRQREKLWAMVWDDHLDTLKLGDYCLQDIATESDVSARLPDLEGEELQWWQHHEEINHRGVPIDIEGVRACAAIIEQTLERYNAELKVLTGIDAASKVAQIQGWLKANGFHLYSLDQDSVEEALARPDVTGVVRRVLEIRGLAGSASVKKVFAMRNRATPEGLLHDLYIFCGAHTGRSTGEGPQPTNLPNSSGLEVFECECGRHYGLHLETCPWCGASGVGAAVRVEWNAEAASDALETIRYRDYELLERYWGDALGAVSACLRGLFKAPDGEQFLSSDWNSIEAVGLAMLSGEKWRIEVFNTHGKIYEVSGAKVMGVSFEDMMEYKKRTGNHHPARKPGKVYELACGYGGWIGSAHAFDAPGTDDEIKKGIIAWRDASPAVVHFWGGQSVGKWQDRQQHLFGVEGMFIAAVQQPDRDFPVMRLDGTHSGVTFRAHGSRVFCTLPSGRRITYNDVSLHPSTRQYAAPWDMEIRFWGWNTNPKNGSTGWIQKNTYGPKLVENINQATCRDILRHAVAAHEARGYPVVLHVYDELVGKVKQGCGSVAEYEAIMMERPAWAHDWPIRAAGGWRGGRYAKG